MHHRQDYYSSKLLLLLFKKISICIRDVSKQNFNEDKKFKFVFSNIQQPVFNGFLTVSTYN